MAILLSLLIILVLAMVSTKLLMRKKGKLPPGPAKFPLLGNWHQLGALPHRALRELSRIHGPVMQLQLGKTPAVVLSSAEAAWEALKDRDMDCCTRPLSPGARRLTYEHKTVAFAPYSAYWRQARKLLVVELLSSRRVKATWHARHEQVEKLMDYLKRSANQPVALDEHLFKLSDGIIGTVAFGNAYGSENFPQSKSFEHAFHDAMEMLSGSSAEDWLPTSVGRLVDLLTGFVARRERIFKQLDQFFEMVIDQHLAQRAEDGGDLIDALIDFWKQDSGITKDHVKAITFSTFIAGVGTSSVAIVWAMSELMANQRVLRKAQAEIRAAMQGGVQLEDVLHKLTYLKLVVKETLRLHPPATLLLPREARRDMHIGGFDVPAKTRIIINVWAISRDPACWPENPEQFIPERFEGSHIDFTGGHPELLPFGAGRRICPGISMAVSTMEYTLASLLHGFDWALPEGTNELSNEEVGRIVYHRKTPLLLVPTIATA